MRPAPPATRPSPRTSSRALIADEADAAWVVARMTPHPLATLTQPLRLGNPAASALPRAFIYCSEGKTAGDSMERFAARLRADPGWRYREVAANHAAPITAPEALAEAFLSLV